MIHKQKIYLASSWRNEYQPEILSLLRGSGFEVYDFRNPKTGGPQDHDTPSEGFSWKQTDPLWGKITPDLIARYKKMLEHPVAQSGFASDFNAMKWADTCVLLLPSGRSAHLEAGWMAGSGRRLVVYMPPAVLQCGECKGVGRYAVIPNQFSGSEEDAACLACKTEGYKLIWSFEPELMYLIGGDPELICTSPTELLARLGWMPQVDDDYDGA